MPPDRPQFFLAVIILFFLAANITWIMADQAPPMWDQAHYLESSVVLYHTLTRQGIIPFFNAFMHSLTTKAPLITVLPIPFYMLGGESYASALCINLFFILIGSIYLYKLVALISARKEALLSVLVFNLFPLIFAMSREFLVEYGLTVFVIAWMYHLLKSQCFKNRKDCYLLGVILGLGMLMKITFILYIFFPSLFIFIREIRELKGIPRTSLKNIVIVFLIGLLFFGPWYISNMRSVIGFALKSGYGDIAENYGIGEVFSIKTILDYWTYNITYGISTYFFSLIVLLLLYKLLLFAKNKSFSNIERRYFYFLLLWFAVPFLIFSFGVNKDYRYLSPIYPALAILMSSVLVRLSSIRYGNALLIMLMLFPMFNYFIISFSSSPVYLKIKQFDILTSQLIYAHPPVKEQWPNKRLIQLIHNDAVRTNNVSARTTLLFNHHYVNFITLNYYSKTENLRLSFDMIDFTSRETPEEAADRIGRDSDYLITKSDKIGPEFSNIKNIPVISLLKKGKLDFRQIGDILLPDETLLTIYKRENKLYEIYPSSESLINQRINAKRDINFSDKIKLLDYKIVQEERGYKLTFFWECLNPVDKNYKIFLHIIDSEGHPLLNADHYPAGGKYPTYYWRKGEIIREVIDIAGPLPGNFHIYIGIYEEATMSRLPIIDEKKKNVVVNNGVNIYMY